MSYSILFQFFRQLRKQGFPLGAADYLLVLEAVRSGLGLEDLEQFKRLLKLLWSKSLEEQKMLDREFNKWVKPYFKLPSAAKSSQENLEDIEDFKLFFRMRLAQSPEEKELFEEAFEELVEPQLQASASTEPQKTTFEPEEQSSQQDDTNTDTSEQTEEESKPTDTPPINEEKQQITIEQKQVEIHFELVQPTPFSDKPELMEELHHYQLTPRLPMSQREMAEIWRQLRRPQRIGIPEELDVAGTIESICRKGFLLKPTLRSRRCNQAHLVVLVDRQGSMAPFSLLVEGIRKSILRSGFRGRSSFYYFHDYPDTYLYKHPQLTGAIQLQKVLFEEIQRKSVLIISDAGAAYGFYEEERREATKRFLKALRSYTYLYAWLNPLPKYRWKATTAEDIEKFVPMFSFNRDGLHDTVNILRGYPFPPGVRLDG